MTPWLIVNNKILQWIVLTPPLGEDYFYFSVNFEETAYLVLAEK